MKAIVCSLESATLAKAPVLAYVERQSNGFCGATAILMP